ncbi:hypothetical protein AKO1_007883, partial [Acrasis kona]
MFAMNSKIHSVIQASPFALMFGRSPFNVVSPDSDKELADDREKMLRFWSIFKDTIPYGVTSLRNKYRESQHYAHKVDVYKVGEIVMLRIPNRNKAEDSYQGPFRITQVLENNTYHLESEVEKDIETTTYFLKRVELNEGQTLTKEFVNNKARSFFECSDTVEDTEMLVDDRADTSFRVESSDSDISIDETPLNVRKPPTPKKYKR